MKAVDRDPAQGGPVYWTALTGDALSRCAVPLFFAIAGWVVLSGAPPRDGRQVRRRLTRIVVPLAVWTALYLLWDRVRDANTEPTRQLARDAVFASVRPAFHLWYLYAYVPVILLLSVAVLVRNGKRPWGAGAALLGLALAPTLLGDLGRLLDVRVPPFAWQFGVYQIAYAVAGAVLLSLPGSAVAGRRRRLLWLAGGLCAWAAVAVYEHRVHFPTRTPPWWWRCSPGPCSWRSTGSGCPSGSGRSSAGSPGPPSAPTWSTCCSWRCSPRGWCPRTRAGRAPRERSPV
ncbi:hypothetical protein STENM327S_03864 [Streptomyces tendae]